MKKIRRYLAFMLILAMAFTMLPQVSLRTEAAAKPSVAKSATVFIGQIKNLSVKKNGFTVTSVKSVSSKRSVAQVKATKTKVSIYGLREGSTTVTTTIKAKKNGVTKSYKTKTTVTVPAMTAVVDDVTLKEGMTTMVWVDNAPDNATFRYESGNTDVVTVDSRGIVTGGSTVGSAIIKVWVTIPSNKFFLGDREIYLESESVIVAEVNNATVSTQDELNKALASGGTKKVTIQGTSSTKFTIPYSSNNAYANISLVVNAPNATVENFGRFKSIEIQSLSSNNSWTEKGESNYISVTGNTPVRVSVLTNLGALNFDSMINGSSTVELTNGTIKEININKNNNVNISTSGRSTLAKLSVGSASTVYLNAFGDSMVANIDVQDLGGTVSIGTAGKARISDISVNRNTMGYTGIGTNLSVSTTDDSDVTYVNLNSAQAVATVKVRDNSRVKNVKLTADAVATISGNSAYETYVDLNSAGSRCKVVLKTEKVKVDAGKGLDVDRIIENKSGSTIFVNGYLNNSNTRSSIPVSSVGDDRQSLSFTIDREGTTKNKILLSTNIEFKNLQKSSLKVYAGSTAVSVSSVSVKNAGWDYVITLGTNLQANTTYTVYITGLDPEKYYDSSVSAKFKTAAATIKLNKTSITKTSADLNTTETLIATVGPDDGLDHPITWSSSNSSVASVDRYGKITFRKVGTAVITAAVSGVKAVCTIKITEDTTPSPTPSPTPTPEPAANPLSNYTGTYTYSEINGATGERETYKMTVITSGTDQVSAVISTVLNGHSFKWEISGTINTSSLILDYDYPSYKVDGVAETLSQSGSLRFYSTGGQMFVNWNRTGAPQFTFNMD